MTACKLGAYLFAMATTGCAQGGSFAPIDGQDRAMQIVWYDLYEETGDPPPVEWIPGKCWGADHDTCGFTWAGSKVQVSRQMGYDGYVSISVTSFAHELMHYRTFLRTGDVDAYHWRGDWDLADKESVTVLVGEGL